MRSVHQPEFDQQADVLNLSMTLDTKFCLEAVEEALARNKPENLQHRSGPPSPSPACCSRARPRSAWIGKGAWRDSVFVERLWRTIKYEEVYLRAYASIPDTRASIGRYIGGYYNARRPHSSLDRRTPDDAYFTALRGALIPYISITSDEKSL
jgi:putative transposase